MREMRRSRGRLFLRVQAFDVRPVLLSGDADPTVSVTKATPTHIHTHTAPTHGTNYDRKHVIRSTVDCG